MPKVQITIRNVATGTTRTAVTDSDGFYFAPNLGAAVYELKAAVPGFVTRVITNINVSVDSKQAVNFVMRPGQGLETTQNRASSDTASAGGPGVGGNVAAATVRNSPLNGRDWTQLASLQPGVSGIQAQSSSQGRMAQRGFGAALSISGGRPEQNSYRLDGVSINDYANGAPGSVLGASLGVDAVEQFSVLGSNYPASYGRTSGGVINAVTRAGTNAFHMSAYEFHRNSALDARNFFDAKIPPFRRNQFGGTAGGPLRKGRTFFFADYEGLRQSLGITHVTTVPSMRAREGQLAAGTVAVDPQVKRYLDAFYPLPNGPLLGNGDAAIFRLATQQVTSENYFTSRGDHRLSSKDSLFGTFMRDNSKIIQPNAFDELLSNVVSQRKMVALQWQHIFSPDFLNVTRWGFSRAVAVDGGLTKVLEPRLLETSFAMVPGKFVGGIRIPGLTPFGGGPGKNLTSLSNSKEFAWTSLQMGNDASLTRGTQALQFGVAVERMRDDIGIAASENGMFEFSSLATFLTNRPRSFQGLLPGPLGVFGTRQTLFGAYLEDDIRARKNFTLNLGVRYEMVTVPTEAHNRISNLRHLTDREPFLGSPYFLNPTLRNFEPRLGLAWSPFKSETSVVRAGFGLFDVLPLPYQTGIITPLATPFSKFITGTSLGFGSFPTAAFEQLAGTPSALRASFIEHQPKRNYVMQWNLKLEQQLRTSLKASLGYVGSHSVHQPFRMDDLNTVLPAKTAAGYLYPEPATSQKLNPNFGRIAGIMWESSAVYDALQVVVAHSPGHGVQARGAFTWGKGIDTSSTTITSDQYDNSLVNPLFFDVHTNRGLSDFNITQNFVANFSWQPPAVKSGLEPLRWAFSNWQLGGIIKASTGVPFTVLLGGDPLGTKLTEVSEVPDLLTGPGCQALTNPGSPNGYIKTQCFAFPAPARLRGNLGRNTLTGPGSVNFDVSLLKNNRVRTISDNLNLQLRAEFFNVFNRANFGSPAHHLAVFDSAGNPVSGAGLITSTQTPAREIQFAVKLIW